MVYICYHQIQSQKYEDSTFTSASGVLALGSVFTFYGLQSFHTYLIL